MGVINLITRRQDERADVDVMLLFCVVVDDGITPAGKDARPALGADATGKTAGGLGLGAGIIVATFHFGKVTHPLIDGQFRQGDARLWLDFALFDACFDLRLGQVDDGQLRFGVRLQRLALQIAQD